MTSFVTEEQVSRYQRDGVVLLRNFFSSEWQESLAEGIEENLRAPSQRSTALVDDSASNAHFFFDARLLGEIGGYDRFMTNSPMAESMARLMSSSQAILFYISVFVRSAGTRQRTPWHQDQKSWAAVGNQACSVWTSLDPVPRDTALEFVRGSHLWEADYERPEFFHRLYKGDDRSKQSAFPDIEAHREDYEILGWDMEPGDCLVFHGMTIHGGSGGLPPGLGRRSVSVQWLGDDARFQPIPDRDDQHISEELPSYGIKPGEPVISEVCPVAWPRG
jgi:ectoine hydroxylase-related dioxygenase (phytanoyl-CoA dioxygenase family)